MNTDIKKKIKRRFTQAEIGFHLRVSQQTVFKWLNKQVPAERVTSLCELLAWEVTPHEIRPDLHPTPVSGIPAGVTLPPEIDGQLNHENQSSD